MTEMSTRTGYDTTMTPFEIKIDGRGFYTLPHDEDREEYLEENPEVDPRDVAIVMVSIFRNKGYMDMVEVVEVDEVEDDYYTHVILGRMALVDWLVAEMLTTGVEGIPIVRLVNAVSHL